MREREKWVSGSKRNDVLVKSCTLQGAEASAVGLVYLLLGCEYWFDPE